MEDQTFSYVDCVTDCLLDTERTEAFEKAIAAQVKPGDIVLDSGTGSSIMALFAARAGAKRVIAVECDPYVAMLARQNIKNNGYEDVIEIIETDIRGYAFEPNLKFDVVLMEMLTTAMIDEYQVWTINYLHGRGLVDSETKFIPAVQETYITLTEADFKMHGFTMKMVLHLWSWLDKKSIWKPLAERVRINTISFNQTNSESFDGVVELDVATSGVINSIYIESKTLLGADYDLGDTLALNAPVLFPLIEEVNVEKGQKVTMSISYVFGNGYRNFHAKVIEVK